MENETRPTGGSHYFSESPDGADRRARFSLNGPWGDLEMDTAGGVFSARGLDRGTAVLLDSLRRHPIPAPPAGSTLVDLGCGSGVLALVLARLYPESHVLAVDVNERALDLCRDNARHNGLTNVTTCRPVDCAKALDLALLLSNPPIRVGKTALHELMLEWLPRLGPSGVARLVVGRNLGADSLARWVSEQGWRVERVSSSQGFRVLDVSAPQ